MRKDRWYAAKNEDRFRQLISDPLFTEAVYVVFGETMAHQMPGSDINAHALNDSFRDGAVWALGQLQALAITPIPHEARPQLKPWASKKRPELDGLAVQTLEE